MRLSTRIALAAGTVVPLLVLASGFLLLQLVTRDLHAQQDAHLRERADAVAKDAQALLRATATGRQAAEQARQRKLFSAAMDVGVRLVGPDGTVSGGPQPDSSEPLPARAPVPVTLEASGSRWRVLSLPVANSRPQARGTLWLFSPDTAARAQLGAVRRRVVTTAVLAAPAAGLLAWAATARATRPLRRLQQRTSGLDPFTSTARLDHAPTGITEVDDLARALQTALTRYDQQALRTTEALATARSFAASASHELRNPLMSMGTDLDVLARHPDLPRTEQHEVIQDLRGEHARLLGLLVMLKALADGDLVGADSFGPVDLAEVVDASVADVRRRHPKARVVVHSPSGLVVQGWEEGLRLVVDNLLSNALVHGGSHGGPLRAEVVLRRVEEVGGPVAVLTVDDEGPGIAPEERPAVFERFHRRPDSPGSGLGLTLVAQQTALHSGRIDVRDKPDGPGARIDVRLPLAGSVAPQAAPLPLQSRHWLGTSPAP
ncbi:sensor histidine kinase [Streptomyces sp. NPDC059176]|uniref:sensor histidine kinase n=1 Tax=Streptomyces sp. NPDC059176 TaxID=3346758 RepID=UPI0036BD9953